MGILISPREVNCFHSSVHMGIQLVKMAGRLTAVNSPCAGLAGYLAVCQTGLGV